MGLFNLGKKAVKETIVNSIVGLLGGGIAGAICPSYSLDETLKDIKDEETSNSSSADKDSDD